ncbi:putative AAA+ ATPase domain, ATPase, AAA-type, core [Helianthus annuus]|uniref:AAA+ ATPase domain, ATPase, AAA-type, core n=1 Tax=Helianthus annuus TaxID=4232 RepID=A0A9K3MY39_HELAN|nr:putative AAA+ ATPase domain, ATPase, AAA-type, core [Helianthus annuus]KAJ0507257.1 putative AAA+ ATPase domain, ATPase, AAA-type, core, AAA ATPase, AAA+ lid domain-containing protein [Helianthus annuus]
MDNQPSMFQKLLLRRIQETYGSSFPPTIQIVNCLRAKHPEYCRHTPQQFTRMVKQTLDSDNSKGKRKFSSYQEGHRSSPATKINARTSSSESDSSESSSSESDSLESSSSSSSSSKSESEEEVCSQPKKKGSKHVEVVLATDKKVDLVMGGKTVKPTVAKATLSHKSKCLPNDDANGEEDGPWFKDLFGIDDVLIELKHKVILPLYNPQVSCNYPRSRMAGILLYGPPGCGKTKLAHAIANESGLPFYEISATEFVSGVSCGDVNALSHLMWQSVFEQNIPHWVGPFTYVKVFFKYEVCFYVKYFVYNEHDLTLLLPFYKVTRIIYNFFASITLSGGSEENIRELFSKAYKTAPSIVFIDEIDAIASKRENLGREMERRIVTQLMTCMGDHKRGYVLVIGATNRPDAVDPALRRTGCFDREFKLGVPDEVARIEILSALTQNIKLEGAFDLIKVARSTPGFVGADLEALVKKAGGIAMHRIFERKLEHSRKNEGWWRKGYCWTHEEIANCSYTMSDFEAAAKLIQPAITRDGFSSIPKITWEDVGGLDSLRREFFNNIVLPIICPELEKKFGIDWKTGFLLYGPPGCGKTLIAQAVANEAGVNFIHIKGPELLNKYDGESELALRTIFSRARTCSPCILFFDELLTELDGNDQREGVYVIAATNRPKVMDKAILRPGRLGTHMYVPLPNQEQREMILKALSRNKPLDVDVDLGAIARSKACANLNGSDLKRMVRFSFFYEC